MTLSEELPNVTLPSHDLAQEAPDFSAEEKFWRDNYEREPYYMKNRDFIDYAPAFRAGYEGRRRYAGLRFEDAENQLRSDYERFRGTSLLTWDNARSAAQAAWNRVERMYPGADGSGL